VNRDATVSVGILVVFLAGTVLLGLLAAARRRRSLTEWSVGGRSLGLPLTWVLIAGETYTSYSYLGAAGWSYKNGVSGLYLVAYLSVGMAVTYVTGPLVVATILVIFMWVPLHYFGGYRELLHRMVSTHPAWLTLPGPVRPALGIGWFVSTSALNAVVYSIFPPRWPVSWVPARRRCCGATRCTCRSTSCCCSYRCCWGSPRCWWCQGSPTPISRCSP
jgi:Na+/proline symporter